MVDKNHQAVVYLMNCAIYGRDVESNKIMNVDWNYIYEYAQRQQIYTILYPVVRNIDDQYKPDKELMLKWKKDTILMGIFQQQSFKKITLVLNAFNKEGIQVMALKGLILRDLYPVKDLRTMGDYDILIHESDIEKAKKILIEMGYLEEFSDVKHAVFSQKDMLEIELHWFVIDTNNFKLGRDLENKIWENPETIDIGGTVVFAPSLENHFLHLLIHKATHFAFSGFGIRQLCDFVLLFKARGHEIDWNTFYDDVKKHNLENFTVAIFEIIRELFGTNIPQIFNNEELKDSEYINMMIYNIISAGVHEGAFGMIFAKGPMREEILSHKDASQLTIGFFNKLKYSIAILFPSFQLLKEKYSYAEKYPILIPIAWANRIIEAILRKDFSIKDKRDVLLTKSAILKKREDLFKWLKF